MGWMMWNWVVSALAQGATVRAVRRLAGGARPAGVVATLASVSASRFFGTGARYLHGLQAAAACRPVTRSTCPRSAPSPRPARRSRRRGSATSTTRVKATCTWRASPAAPTSSAASCSACRRCPCTTARSSAPVSASIWPCSTRRPRGPLRAKASWCAASRCRRCRCGFWGDAGHRRYRAAYFERFPGVWCHGDLIERTPEGGVVVYGRSDATLNPGGVRIGTAEIYRPLEALPEVIEACAVGRRAATTRRCGCCWCCATVCGSTRTSSRASALASARPPAPARAGAGAPGAAAAADAQRQADGAGRPLVNGE
jgi:acetoacetyl-CoA synthetase